MYVCMLYVCMYIRMYLHQCCHELITLAEDLHRSVVLWELGDLLQATDVAKEGGTIHSNLSSILKDRNQKHITPFLPSLPPSLPSIHPSSLPSFLPFFLPSQAMCL